MPDNKRYLGNGVYVSFDGMICLTTEDGRKATNTIYLEREVWEQLVEYVKQVEREQDA